MEDDLKWCNGCKEFHPRHEFGKDRSTKDGLARACRKYRNSISHTWNDRNNPKRYEETRDVVYFIEEEGSSHIKIGSTNNLRMRLSQLQIGNPKKLSVLHVEDGYETDEKMYHRIFAHRWQRGEWFLFD